MIELQELGSTAFMEPYCMKALDLLFWCILSPKTFIGVYLHVKLENLRVNRALETQIYEWHELDSSKIEYIVFACDRLGESFIGLGESSHESPSFPPFRVCGVE